jgi:hypothetical protein
MIYDLSQLPYSDTPPWELTAEQRAERDQFMVKAEAVRQERLKQQCVAAAPIPHQVNAMSNEAAAWVAANPWVNQQSERFTRTHFRPSVLRRRNLR